MIKLRPGCRVRWYLPSRCTTCLLPWGTVRTPLKMVVRARPRMTSVTNNPPLIVITPVIGNKTILSAGFVGAHHKGVAREFLDVNTITVADRLLAQARP